MIIECNAKILLTGRGWTDERLTNNHPSVGVGRVDCIPA